MSPGLTEQRKNKSFKMPEQPVVENNLAAMITPLNNYSAQKIKLDKRITKNVHIFNAIKYVYIVYL